MKNFTVGTVFFSRRFIICKNCKARYPQKFHDQCTKRYDQRQMKFGTCAEEYEGYHIQKFNDAVI